MVVSHEFGHFIVAKKSGIRVDEFAFGFKPRLWSIKKGETTYSINALPIGGYVSIFGENPDDENTNGPDRDRSFVHKPKYIQALVLVAGVVMNFLVAWLLFTVGFMAGMPALKGIEPKGVAVANKEVTFLGVAKNSPAELAGIVSGDKPISMSTASDSTQTPSVESVQYFIKKHSTEAITISYKHGITVKEVVLTPSEKFGTNGPGIGVSLDTIGKYEKLPIYRALWEGLRSSVSVFGQTFVGFYDLIHGALFDKGSIDNVTGPVGLVSLIGKILQFGFIYLVVFTGIISLNLAVINLIPFPALDGGRLLFLLIERIKGSRIKPKIANIVNMIGFMLLMLLMVVVTFNDIRKLL